MASTPHPHELPPRNAAVHSPPSSRASSDLTQSVDRTSTSDSSFSALGEVLSSTVGVAPKHLPRFGVGAREQAASADVARSDPTPCPEATSGAPPSLQEGETLHPAPPRPIPCEAFEINMDILREIIAEQRAAQPVTSTILPVARASSTTLPSITTPEDGASPAHAEPQQTQSPQHTERPASALSITSAKSGALGSTPKLRESAAAEAQVEAWSAGVANAGIAPPDGVSAAEGTSNRPPGTPLSKGVVEPLHGGFYLAEAAGTPVSPTGQRALPRLSHSAVQEDDAPSESTVEAEEGGDGDGPKRVSLATRLRGEAKVLAGKLKNDDAKVAEGRALKSGEAP